MTVNPDENMLWQVPACGIISSGPAVFHYTNIELNQKNCPTCFPQTIIENQYIIRFINPTNTGWENNSGLLMQQESFLIR